MKQARSEERTPYQAFPEAQAKADSLADQDACIARALRILSNRVKRGPVMGNSRDTRNWLTLELADSEREIFGILTLDTQHRLIKRHDLFAGSVDRARVYPREVLKRCLEDNAAECIAFHNHPSGSETPSASDKSLTWELRELLEQIEVTLADHIVVASQGSVSFVEEGWL